jgi:hypothetical protein
LKKNLFQKSTAALDQALAVLNQALADPSLNPLTPNENR